MYINSIFASFDELSRKFSLPRSSLFRYFQVRRFIQYHDTNFPHMSSSPSLDDLLGAPFSTKRLISRINNCISSFKDTNFKKIKADWLAELGGELESEDIWDNTLLKVNGSTSCARLSIIQFKILHRIHYSKAKLARIYPNVEANCDRCRHTPANLSHMFWLCPSQPTGLRFLKHYQKL